MPEKKPFITLEQAQEIIADVPTPFHLYDEKGIRANARLVNKAFAWNKGFKEFFAVKATPNPYLLRILKEEGCGVDCSSYTELLLSEACGFSGSDIMFSSNETPVQDMKKAYDLGAYINLDDLTHVDFLKNVAGIPETICCRFNPGGTFDLGNGIMDNPGDSKYGMSEEQMTEAYTRLMALGAKNFGIHAFLASNTVTDDYYPELAGILFNLAVRLHQKTGAHIKFINLSGGVGVAYKPEQRSNDILAIGEGVRKKFEEILVPAGMGDVAIFTEMGRFMPVSCSTWLCVCTKRPVHTSSSSTCPAASALPTSRSSAPMISWPLARVSAKSLRRSWCPPVWATLPSLPRWGALCWLRMAAWLPQPSTKSTFIKSISAWMPALPT